MNKDHTHDDRPKQTAFPENPSFRRSQSGRDSRRSNQQLIMGSDTFAKGVGHHASA